MGYIAIADYGAGNLHSVVNALEYLGTPCEIADRSEQIDKASGVILPGVGAFPDAMDRLDASGLTPALKEAAAEKPLLGICLGMQMLLSKSFELRERAGLDLIPGKVERINTDLKLPQIGWNKLNIVKQTNITEGLPKDAYVYFVHSFCGVLENREDLVASTDYGTEVTAIIAKGNVFGCQFHPEKSGDVGLEILKNFTKLC